MAAEKTGIKKVVLIQPPSPFLLEPLWKAPLTLCTLKTFLDGHGLEVELIDLADRPADGQWPIPLDADLYGLSVYTAQHNISLAIADYLKEKTEALIIAGGHHVTALGEEFLGGSAFDLIVVGEGEETLLDVCRGLPFAEIPGIIYQENGGCKSTGARQRILNLATVPLPRFDKPFLRKYKGNWVQKDHSEFNVGVLTSRGCHFRCAFCSSRFFWRQKVRWYDTDAILDYLEYLAGQGIRDFEFLDDNFLLHPGFTDICRYLKGLEAQWTCMGRSDCVKDEIAKLLKDSGCAAIALGIETGSDAILKRLEKKCSVAANRKAIATLKKHGVYVKAFMMAGFPGETAEDADKTIRFIREEPVDMYTFSMFVPYPGTPVWLAPEKYGARINRQIPYEAYAQTTKNLATRPILDDHEQTQIYLRRYIDAARDRCTNVNAFDRTDNTSMLEETIFKLSN